MGGSSFVIVEIHSVLDLIIIGRLRNGNLAGSDETHTKLVKECGELELPWVLGICMKVYSEGHVSGLEGRKQGCGAGKKNLQLKFLTRFFFFGSCV